MTFLNYTERHAATAELVVVVIAWLMETVSTVVIYLPRYLLVG